MAEPWPAPQMRVVRLAPWLLEVVRERADRPWDEAVSTHNKRSDAERAAVTAIQEAGDG
jgi:hypothetical protein